MKRTTFLIAYHGPNRTPARAPYPCHPTDCDGIVIHRRPSSVPGEPVPARAREWDVSHAVSGMRINRQRDAFATRADALAFCSALESVRGAGAFALIDADGRERLPGALRRAGSLVAAALDLYQRTQRSAA